MGVTLDIKCLMFNFLRSQLTIQLVIDDKQKKIRFFVKTMAKLCMAHASTHGPIIMFFV